MTVTDVNVVKSAIFERPDDANKGTLGSLLCVCGSYGMAGAAVMSAKGALRTGIGLAKCALPRSIYPIVAQTILESVYYPLSENADGRISKVNVPFLVSESCKSSATLVGCGLGVCDDTLKIVFSLIENSTTPLVLDADALNCVAKQPEILLRKKAPIIITPHPGEMSRLTGLATPLVNAERERVALDFAQKYGVVTVLKGAGTVIASPNGKVLVNPTGNSGMATGGSGDVLALGHQVFLGFTDFRRHHKLSLALGFACIGDCAGYFGNNGHVLGLAHFKELGNARQTTHDVLGL